MTSRSILEDDRLPGGRLVVAVSGGVDSMVLLHHLCFSSGRSGDVLVAHLDHAMRPGSRDDASWLQGVCAAWEVPVRLRRLDPPPAGEDEARQRRYAFLEEVREESGATAILTAHHADDQAETVLFRILRGTGVKGLRGMSPVRGRVVRPMLERWRSDLQAYADRHAVPFRRDPTNRDLARARNALRHVVLPAAESGVASASRRALVRLAANAARQDEEARALESWVFRDAVREASEGRLEIPAELLESLPDALRRRLLRRAASRGGVALSQRATDLALAAVEGLRVGGRLDLTGGLCLERARDRWILIPPASAWARHTGAASAVPSSDGQITVPTEGAGEAILELGPVRWQVAWGPRPLDFHPQVEVGLGLPQPLTVRGWRPGDRVRRGDRSRSAARFLSESGVPVMERPCHPVVLDGGDRVVWIPGITATGPIREGSEWTPGGERLYLGCARLSHG